MSIVIWLLTFALVVLSVFLVLIVLMQKTKSDGGVGAALGGGMTEAAFGADTGNLLATLTKNGTIAFFIISFGLYLAHIHRHTANKEKVILPALAVPAAATVPPTVPAPTESTAATSVSVPAVVTPLEAAPAASAPAEAVATEPAK